MRFKNNVFFIVVVVFILSGCSGIMGNSKRSVSSNLVDYLYPDGQLINHQNDKIPHLKLPLKIGIAFIPERESDSSFTISEAEKQQLMDKVVQQFSSRSYIEHIEVIPEIYLKQKKGFNSLEQIARLHDVDVMALISYDQVSMRKENSLSLAYLTIIGAYILPGENTEAQTFVDAAVFDVATRRLLFRAPGVDSIDKSHSLIGFEKSIRDMRIQSFHRAVDKMTINLDKSLEKFREKAKSGEFVKVSYRDPSIGGGTANFLMFLLLLGYFLLRFSGKKQ